MDALEFWGALKRRGIDFISGVPDSTFQNAYNVMVADPDITYVPAIREDVALGIASSTYFVGSPERGQPHKLGGVIMQNSGLGNLVNPLTSFNLIYRIPAFLIVGWRGYGGPPNDAPEHWIMGIKTPQLFDLLDIPYEILESHNLESALDRLLPEIKTRSVPGALLVRAGVLT